MMPKDLVSKSWQEKNGMIVHQLSRPLEDSPKTIKYASVCGGLGWPTESSPAFFCIVGRLWDEKTRFVGQERKDTIQLLWEEQSDSLSVDDFFRKITDAARMFYCRILYANIEGDWEPYLEAFRRYVLQKNLDHHVSLAMAPYENNFLYGVQVINDLRKESRIEIPEDTIIFDQLSRATKDDLQQEEPEIRFFAINALRHAVNAVEKYGRNTGIFRPNRRSTIGSKKYWRSVHS